MNKKVYDFGVFQDYGTDDPNSLIKDNSSIIYGTDEEGNQIYYSAGENITLDGGKISSTGSGGGNVDDVQIDGVSILNEKIANINLGTNLSFDESTNTLNAKGGEYTEKHVTIQLSVSEGVVDFKFDQLNTAMKK